MEATARVIAVADGRARLACEDRAACASCGSGRGCALRWLSSPGRPTLDVPDQTEDRRHLRAGEAVIVETRDGEVLRAAALAYLPPLAGLLVGALLGRGLAAGPGEGAALAAAVAGLSAGIWTARAWSRRYPPRIRVRLAPEDR
ncbi:MAG: hypothetical protein FIB04_08250 [Gammaproteobacteria bacterium]|nr:hypothetical protein [Gammaproteobacteria bacterium]